MSLSNFNLREKESQRIKTILAGLHREVRAELVLLISRSGQPLVITGAESDTDCTALASLAAASLAATDGLANVVGEKEFSVLVHQGRRHSLLISDLLKRFSLVVVFDATTSLGLVRYKCKRTGFLLEDVIRSMQQNAEDGSMPDYPDFSDDELEALLGNIGP